ncbi:RDD family protein [Schaalia sp. 19OD2882]|uniref:RDD family protein n=1 Tax=Schaalia sp. 19OD2882 TaxID=2794089 RepID=UPI001C1EC6D2|nr:RDD family protein [Schaalia sp. 19OD2882]QWW19162.1 RDD family protein [Schaalia sp. 19OD2882]
MAEIRVEGRVPVTVPDHLDGLVAAGNTPRVSAHVVDVSVTAVLLAAAGATFAWHSTGTAPGVVVLVILACCLVAALVHGAISVLGLVGQGQTVGMRVAGVRWIGIETGAPDPARNLLKLALEMIFALPTAGVATALVSYYSQGEMNRTWFDRICGTLSVRAESEAPARLPAQQLPEEREIVEEACEQLDAPRHYTLLDTPTLPSLEETLPPGHEPVPQEVVASDSPVPSTWASVDTARLLSDSRAQSDLERSIGLRPKGAVRLVFDDGTKFDLVDALVVGRAPTASGEREGMATYTLADEECAVSKSHLLLRVREGAVFVEDLASTNGTRLSTRNGTERSLTPGEPVEAPPGTLILFGTRMVLVSG